MNKRFFLALLLTAIVIVATPLLFTNKAPGTNGRATGRDSVAGAPGSAARPSAPLNSATSTSAPGVASGGSPNGSPSGSPGGSPRPTPSGFSGAPSQRAATMPVAMDSTDVATIVHLPRATYTFSNRGGAATSVVLDNYVSQRPVAGAHSARLIENGDALSRFHLALGRDTIALDTVHFALQARADGVTPLVYGASVAGHDVRLSYAFAPDSSDAYLIHVGVNVAGAPAGSSVQVELPHTMYTNERDTLDDIGHLAVAYRSARRDVKSVAFGKIDSTEILREPGPIAWAATRNKYFLVAYRAGDTPFENIRLLGASRTGKVATHAFASVSVPLKADGTAAFDIYAGPQDFVRLQRLGSDLDQVNPYGSFLRAVVQPFAAVIMRALLWMKYTTHLNYGWVLVLFGIMIRLVLWPLNQGAMRTSMKMQRLQPELQAIQKQYSDDPKRQQEAIMKVYSKHGMSPLSPLMGCLPLVLPMPVLFALYHVFGNTIEFRGVSFLWLPDISARDPFFITPLLMGATMFLMSWITMRNAPPNPQAKMMSYMMPVMMTVIFLNFASGLNLYYAVQNLAAIPQQWLLARERAKPTNAIEPVVTKRRAERNA